MAQAGNGTNQVYPADPESNRKLAIYISRLPDSPKLLSSLEKSRSSDSQGYETNSNSQLESNLHYQQSNYARNAPQQFEETNVRALQGYPPTIHDFSQNNYNQNNTPQSDYPLNNYPQNNYTHLTPQNNAPQNNYPQNNTSQSNYPLNNYPQNNYTHLTHQNNTPQNSYPQNNYSQNNNPQNNYSLNNNPQNNYSLNNNPQNYYPLNNNPQNNHTQNNPSVFTSSQPVQQPDAHYEYGFIPRRDLTTNNQPNNSPGQNPSNNVQVPAVQNLQQSNNTQPIQTQPNNQQTTKSNQAWYLPLPSVHKSFRATVGRTDAEELLKNEREGTYLFRPSSAQTTSGQPALATSYRYDQGVGHGIIYRVGRKFSGSENPGDIAYDSLDDMVSTLNYHIYPLQSGATIPK